MGVGTKAMGDWKRNDNLQVGKLQQIVTCSTK